MEKCITPKQIAILEAAIDQIKTSNALNATRIAMNPGMYSDEIDALECYRQNMNDAEALKKILEALKKNESLTLKLKAI